MKNKILNKSVIILLVVMIILSFTSLLNIKVKGEILKLSLVDVFALLII